MLEIERGCDTGRKWKERERKERYNVIRKKKSHRRKSHLATMVHGVGKGNMKA